MCFHFFIVIIFGHIFGQIATQNSSYGLTKQSVRMDVRPPDFNKKTLYEPLHGAYIVQSCFFCLYIDKLNKI